MNSPPSVSSSESASALPAYTLWQLVRYMLRLGTLGFGDPVALVGYMYRDLVEHRRWISDADYKEGMALAQLMPGPLITSHHENNSADAVKRLNAIRVELAGLDWNATATFTINGLKREELIAANSAFLHQLYFDNLGGDGVLPSCGLSIALTRDFGSVEAWRSQFTGLAKAMGGGSGWALLSWSSCESRLVNHWAADHTHLLAGATPVLALDMYEHAYHMDFDAEAGAYVDAFMANVQWEKVYKCYGAAVEADTLAFGIETTAVKTLALVSLDARRKEDYVQSGQVIQGAAWRDPSRVHEWRQELDASKPVVLYCLRGKDIGRSTVLALRSHGVDARYIVGGIEAWQAAGLPVQAQTPAQ